MVFTFIKLWKFSKSELNNLKYTHTYEKSQLNEQNLLSIIKLFEI